MTDAGARSSPDAFSILREIVRRSGHEIRNALSGIAVNVEVVRSHVGRGAIKEAGPFAERASSDVSRANALTNATLAIVDAVLRAAAAGTIRAGPGYGAASEMEVMIYGDGPAAFVSDIRHLVEGIGVGVEERGQSVIFRVFPEDKHNSKD